MKHRIEELEAQTKDSSKVQQEVKSQVENAEKETLKYKNLLKDSQEESDRLLKTIESIMEKTTSQEAQKNKQSKDITAKLQV